jgi:Raf kinase inhibitor-like YbhB/YbcL family protein
MVSGVVTAHPSAGGTHELRELFTGVVRYAVGIALFGPVAGSGVGAGAAPGNTGVSMTLSLMSPSFHEGGAIPRKHTCEGQDTSPPLVWSGVRANAKSVALIVDDPDAPDPQKPERTWVHWILYDLPPDLGGLPEGVTNRNLPAGARQGLNDFERFDWGGPCPPIGRHRYFFKLYVLDTVLGDLGGGGKAALEAAMKGHVLANAQVMGTYERG